MSIITKENGYDVYTLNPATNHIVNQSYVTIGYCFCKKNKFVHKQGRIIKPQYNISVRYKIIIISFFFIKDFQKKTIKKIYVP